MKNIFSKSLYLQGLRKIRTAGIAMAIIIVAINALIPIVCIVDSQFDFPGMNRTVQTVEAQIAAPAGISMILFAPLLTYIMFSFLNERKSSDFYHSLPQKRVCVYTSFIAAILTWIAGTLIASALLNSFLWAIARFYTVSPLAMVMSAVTYFITALMLVGFMALAMTVTGTTVSNVLVFILFTFFVRAFGIFFLYGLEEIAPMFNSMNSWLSMFDFDFFLPLRLFIDFGALDHSGFYDAGLLCYWTIVGILLLVAAGFFYHRRRSENATKSAPTRWMQHIYRIAVTFPFMMFMMFMILIDGGMESYHLIFLVFAALVWIIYELLTTKKIKNVWRSAPLFFVPVLLSLCYVASVYGARTIVYNTTPDRDDIVSVQLEGGSRYSFGNWENLIVYTHSVKDPDVLDMVPIALSETKETLYMTHDDRYNKGYNSQATLTLELKSGRKVTYDLYSHFSFYSAIENSDDLADLCRSLPPDESITNISIASIGSTDAQNAIWSAFREDYAAMTDQERAGYRNWNEREYGAMRIRVYGKYRDYHFNTQYALGEEYTPKAFALFMAYHNKENPPIHGLERARDSLNRIMKDEEHSDLHFVSLEITGMSKEKGSIYTDDIRVVAEFLNRLEIDKHLMDYTTAKHIYKVLVYIDTDYMARYYEIDENGLKQYVNAKDTNYYINDSYYVTLSDEDIQMYYEIEKKYPNNEKAEYERETEVIVVN